MDEHTGEALPFATIQIKPNGPATVADSLGNFLFTSLCSGRYVIICSHVGCDPVFDTLDLDKNEFIEFTPEHHAEELHAVLIRGEKLEEPTTFSSRKIKAEDMELSRGEPLGENLKSIPGMTSINTGGTISKPVLHGLTGQRLVILNNGIRHESQQWGNGHAPEVDPYISQEIEVKKGAQSVQYGPDAIAGAVLIQPKALPSRPGLKGELNLAGFSNGWAGVASATLEGSMAKVPGLSYRIQGTLKRGGDQRTPNYNLTNTGVREYNFSWAAGYLKRRAGLEFFYSQFNSDLAILSAAHIGNLTDLQTAFSRSEPFLIKPFSYEINRPFQHLEHELFKVRSYWKPSENTRVNLVYGRQFNLREEYDKPHFRTKSYGDNPELDFRITTHTADLNLESWSNNRYSGKIGVFGMAQKNSFVGRYFIPFFEKEGLGIYAYETAKFGDFLVQAGARYDVFNQKVYLFEGDSGYIDERSFSNFSLTAGLNYTPDPKWKFGFNLGSAWRPPYVNEMYSDGVHHGSATYEIGNPNLIEEKSIQINLDGEYKTKRLNLYAEAYYINFQNYIYLKPELEPTLTIRGAFPTFIYDQVPAHYYGLDLSSRAKLSDRVEWTLRSSIVRAFNKNTNEFLVFIPADRIDNQIRYKLPNRKKERNGFIGIGNTYVFKQWRVDPEAEYVPPPEAYALFYVEAGLRVWVGKQPLNLFFKVNNLLNTSYRDYLNRYRYFVDDLGRNISFKINIPFSLKQTI